MILVLLLIFELLVACSPRAPSQSQIASETPTQALSETFTPLPSPTLTQTFTTYHSKMTEMEYTTVSLGNVK